MPTNEEIAAKARENMQRAKEAIARQKAFVEMRDMTAYQQINTQPQSQNNMLQNAYTQGLGSTQGLATAGIWGGNQYINNLAGTGTLTIGIGGLANMGAYDNPYGWVQVPPGDTIPIGTPIMRARDGTLLAPDYAVYRKPEREPEPVREVAAGERALDLEVTPMEISVPTAKREIDL